ncbi:20172_t:CDS:1, partial [Racocetra persica]
SLIGFDIQETQGNIGDLDIIVKIDESKFSRQKYNYSHRVER